jgi:hypothetical protein
VRIRAAVEQTAPAYQRKELQAAAAEKLAMTVEENVAYMVAHCKLFARGGCSLARADRPHDERSGGAQERSCL